jgi:hypothetical protein
MIKMSISEKLSVLKYAFKAVATGAVVYFMPEIARATNHGWSTLIFGGFALLFIWAA